MRSIIFALKLFIAGYIIYTALLFALPFAKFKIYETAVKKIVTSEKLSSIDDIKKSLLNEAIDLAIDITPDNITIEDLESSTKITINYQSEVKLPLLKKTYIFNHNLIQFRVKKEN